MGRSNWYALDNSAKIMPSMTTDINTNVFRLVCSLKEDVLVDILNEALKKTLREFPLFSYQMNNGLFWHYLEKSEVEPCVVLENKPLCSHIDNGLLFRVSYYKKRINLEVYHVLADGNGAMEFLKYLVCAYLDIKYKLDLDIPLNESSSFERERDDFKMFDRSNWDLDLHFDRKAYKFKFKTKDDVYHDVIEMHMSVRSLKEIAKKYKVSITVLLTAIYIKSIIDNVRVRDLKRPIGITIPVDLRNIFPSRTSRNFFYTVLVSYKYKNDNSLECVIREVSRQLDEHLKKENLQKKMNSFMLAEKLIFIRIIPNFIKDLGLKLASYVGRMGQTSVLSNLGIVKVPSEYEDYIESFSAISSTEDLQLTICSFKDNIVLSFSSHLINKNIERTVLKYIRDEKNIDVKVISNVVGDL